jgi:hypothetical protein
MLYIASPYTHSLSTVRKARAYCASKLAGELMRRVQHDWLFSPIAQGHEVALHLPGHIAESHEFWMRQCRQALAEASCLYLLPLPGWEESKGLTWELDYCQSKSLPVVYLDCRTWAILHLRSDKFNYRSPAELHAKAIWEYLAAQPRIVQIPKWRRDWRVRELLEMPLVGEEKGRYAGTTVTTIIMDELEPDDE